MSQTNTFPYTKIINLREKIQSKRNLLPKVEVRIRNSTQILNQFSVNLNGVPLSRLFLSLLSVLFPRWKEPNNNFFPVETNFSSSLSVNPKSVLFGYSASPCQIKSNLFNAVMMTFKYNTSTGQFAVLINSNDRCVQLYVDWVHKRIGRIASLVRKFKPLEKRPFST